MSRTRKSLYPGYDVLNKRDTPSWDDATRAVIAERLGVRNEPQFCDAVQWLALTHLCRCIVPQADAEPRVPLASFVDAKLASDKSDGYRDARLPPLREAWRIGLAALDAESRAQFGLPFASVESPQQRALLEQMQRGDMRHEAWQTMPSRLFFEKRILHDICSAYYAHPHAWSEIGFGGPANPRGYVRLYFDRRDPWEAVEAQPGGEARARKENQRAR